jgi:hypothetical protein
MQAARHQAFQEGAPVHLGLGKRDGDAEDAALAGGLDADGGKHGAIVRNAMLAGFLVTSVKEEIAEAAEGAVPPGFELVIEQSRGPADLGRGQALDAEFGQHLLDGARGDALHIHLGGA